MMIKNLFRSYRKNEDGVAIIEAVMILPVAILLFIGVFETGQMLLLNQKVSSASHMAADLLARKALLNNTDIREGYDAARLVIAPFDDTLLEMNIVGVQFNGDNDPVQIWQRSFLTPDDDELFEAAAGLGGQGEGAIIVSAGYTYQPYFLNLQLPFIDSNIFEVFDMREISVLRGRVNSCITYNDEGTLFRC